MRPPLLALATLAAACGLGGPDPRIATPEATVETVLRATHLWGTALAGPPTGLAPDRWAPDPGPPPDLAALALCFWDLDRDDAGSRGMAEFVAGMLAAGGSDLEYQVGRRRATVLTRGRPVHMRRTSRGYRIVLAETVPPEIRAGLRRGGAAPPARSRREEP